MTITLAWWALPLVIIVIAVCLASLLTDYGDWGFVNPLLRAGIVFVGLGISAGMVVGKLFL